MDCLFAVNKDVKVSEWTHLTLAWSSSDGKLETWVNGTATDTWDESTAKDAPLINTEDGQFAIGVVGLERLLLAIIKVATVNYLCDIVLMFRNKVVMEEATRHPSTATSRTFTGCLRS